MTFRLLFFLFLVHSAKGIAQVPATSPATISVHDPVMIKEKGKWYLYSTGKGISVWRSEDKINWEKLPPVFADPPAWAIALVPSYKGHTWAPDISYKNGLYYLYYSVSAFGKNRSCIGLAINKTLNPSAPDYKWVDKGMVLASVPGRDNWNAIDPNIIRDEKDSAWMVFGSFWGGIKLFKLNATQTAPLLPEQWITVANRSDNTAIADSSSGSSAIEAPFLFRKDTYFYLFVSFDYCCRGEQSTYKIMVGRSKLIQGPYLDKAGIPMTKGGGELLLKGGPDWFGIRHNAVVSDDGHDWLVCHGYDAKDNGKSKLIITQLDWENGWPKLKSEKHH